ncbi:OmpA family protein [Streptomyces sp. RFCAC02]|uniref:OmpA family protein n=1 Tax=Streptomyces sp. RFCAC02 TaxID=2499143 RepID=UPI00101F7F9E|nr:OmpA family protein [Streptomyces sp. RFCAC02]
MTYGVQRQARAAAALLAGVAVITMGTPALADDGDTGTEQPPGYEAPPVPEVDPDASGLQLADGAELAEPRVLDIRFITESLGDSAGDEGGQSGEETTTDGSTGGGGGEEPNGSDDGAQREERVGSSHKFTLQTDVIFGEGSSEITPESEEALAEVAAAIDEYQPARVNVFGFTDDQGSYDSGTALSEERARNTQEVLLGLIEDPSGIEFNVRGYSEDYPLYDNETEEGRQRNRRVEISWPTTE